MQDDRTEASSLFVPTTNSSGSGSSTNNSVSATDLQINALIARLADVSNHKYNMSKLVLLIDRVYLHTVLRAHVYTGPAWLETTFTSQGTTKEPH